jgi:hypothetical protein
MIELQMLFDIPVMSVSERSEAKEGLYKFQISDWL